MDLQSLSEQPRSFYNTAEIAELERLIDGKIAQTTNDLAWRQTVRFIGVLGALATVAVPGVIALVSMSNTETELRARYEGMVAVIAEMKTSIQREHEAAIQRDNDFQRHLELEISRTNEVQRNQAIIMNKLGLMDGARTGGGQP